jgi:hypothetical protein
MDESTNPPTNAADELVTSAAHLPEHVADPCGRATAIEALRQGPHWSRGCRVYRCTLCADHLVRVLHPCVHAKNLVAEM